MGRIYNKDLRLESHRFFHYIAWFLVIVFAIFVYNITIQLKETADRLEQRTTLLEQRINTPAEKITDFNN